MPRMIKICDTTIVTPLQIIFDTCTRTGIFPDKWKMSNVYPIHKKDSKMSKENYRAISLLPILAKMLEKIIFETLYDYFINNKLITPCQSGFIKGDFISIFRGKLCYKFTNLSYAHLLLLGVFGGRQGRNLFLRGTSHHFMTGEAFPQALSLLQNYKPVNTLVSTTLDSCYCS